MGLARDQQHLELVAHAFQVDEDLVVDLRQLARITGDLELDQVRPGMLDLDRQGHGLVGRHGALGDRDAVAARHQLGRPEALAGLAQAHDDVLGLADDAETRRLDQLEPAVALAIVAGDQGMERCSDAERLQRGRDVVHLPVGDGEDAGEAIRRDIGQRGLQCREQPCAVGVRVGIAGLDDPDLCAGAMTELLLEVGERPVGLRGALADALARAAIDQHGHDIVELVAIFVDDRRVGEATEQQQTGKRAQPRHLATHKARDEQDQQRRAAADGKQQPGQQRIETETEMLLHQLPSLSSSAGTCT
jgi:hypothetical protein